MKALAIVILSLAFTDVIARAGASPDTLRENFGPRFKAAPEFKKPKGGPKKGLDAVHRWNQIAIDATGFDHGAAREQLGPGRASRAMAIVHIAIFDAANAVMGGYISYTALEAPHGPMSVDVAIAQAAHDTLVALFPSQAATFDAELAEDLEAVRNRHEKANGIVLGKRVAATILDLRSSDGSQHHEPVLGVDWNMSDLPGHWRQDPISLIPIALGAHWGECAPFVMESTSQFRCPPFPAMSGPEYAAAYNEAKRLGGDGITTPTERTPEQTFIGVFWGYDGTPSLCAPPRFYNQIAVQIADHQKISGLDLARLLALVNVALADAGTSCWESKFYYDIWRPITAIRESDPGTGPTGLGDGNAATVGDPNFTPIGAPASNLNGPNFTPPFPAYPSGHATFGGALFQMLRRFCGRDDIPFTIVSDEFNGVTKGNDGNVRPYVPRSFAKLSDAEEENGQSRIYLGIHWSFDKTEGIALGRRVADYIYDHAFRPAHAH